MPPTILCRNWVHYSEHGVEPPVFKPSLHIHSLAQFSYKYHIMRVSILVNPKPPKQKNNHQQSPKQKNNHQQSWPKWRKSLLSSAAFNPRLPPTMRLKSHPTIILMLYSFCHAACQLAVAKKLSLRSRILLLAAHIIASLSMEAFI